MQTLDLVEVGGLASPDGRSAKVFMMRGYDKTTLEMVEHYARVALNDRSCKDGDLRLRAGCAENYAYHWPVFTRVNPSQQPAA